MLLVLVILSLAGCGQSSYEDCLLQNLKGAKDDLATQLIVSACDEKYGDKTPSLKSRELTDAERKKLSGRWKLLYDGGNQMEVTVHNGNEDITVTEIIYTVRSTIGGKESSNNYKVNIYAKPLSTANETFTILTGDKPSEYDLSVASVKGHK